VVGHIDELGTEPIDYVLVCTKSFDSPAVARTLSRAACCQPEACKIVLFQNGWGNFEIFTESIEPQRVFNARVITGFQRLSPGHVEVTVHADAIKIGTLADAEADLLAGLADRITQGGIPCQMTPTIAKDLWSKMLYNCCLNPLGAILEATYGSLGDSAAARSVMQGIANEVFQVMRAAGYTTHWDDVESFLRVFYDQMIPATYAHESSMLQDVKTGRRTEIDALNGSVVVLGERLGIETPYNRSMHDLVRFKEKQAADGWI
jgi:2-dehydropantoate 2-reductase